jgi:predicted nucleic-acid-binding protein
MTDYLLDTNILLRIVQPEASTYMSAVEAIISILNQGNNIFITPKF